MSQTAHSFSKTLSKFNDRAEEGRQKQEQLAFTLASDPLELTRFRNERNLMQYPFCSTNKKGKRTNPIDYVSANGEKWLQVTANATHGMAKIWDFDILRFAISKGGEIQRTTGIFPYYVDFTTYELLTTLRRNPKSGKNYEWVKGAIQRIATTNYTGNIFSNDSKKHTSFNLITWEYVESKNSKTIEKIRIHFTAQLLESIRDNSNLLAINDAIIKEESGIKKRLLELVAVYMGNKNEWAVHTEQLQKMCANEDPISEFKRVIKKFNNDDNFPWSLYFENTAKGHKTTFQRKA